MSSIGGVPTPAPIVLPSILSPGLVTGTTIETILGYVNVPGGLMGLRGAIELDTIIAQTGSAGSIELDIRIITGTVAGLASGGTVLVNGTIGTDRRTRWNGLIASDGSASLQVIYPNASAAFTAAANALGTSAINTANAFTISINGKLGSALDTMTLRYLRAVFHPGV